MIDTVMDFFIEFMKYSFGPGNRLWPGYIVITMLLCFLIFKFSRQNGSFFKWLFPKSIYLHPSNLVDLNLFLVGRLLAFSGIFQLVALTSLIASLILVFFGGSQEEGERWNPLIVGLILVVGSDFTTYWVHRIHHETKSLWPFHSVHHSAEVMTPLTVYRKHPIYDLISVYMKGIVGGIIQGVLLSLFIGQVSIATIFGANAIYVAFNIIGANLRHSHIWLSYGPVLEHIFISPAQHQIHHSRARCHWNKNYGEIFAIWDWMFGTLYVPKGPEALQFGISNETEPLIEQPHGSLKAALFEPFSQFFMIFKQRESNEKKVRQDNT